MEKTTKHLSALFHVSSSNGTDDKSHSRSRSRDMSLEAAKGISEDTPDTTLINTATSSFSKNNSGSRGSSPASKKKQLMDSCGSAGSSRKRSPLVVRKTLLASEVQHATPPTGRTRQHCNLDDTEPDASHELAENVDEVETPTLVATPIQFEKTREMVDNLELKVQKTAELIKEEQKLRDENVDEYLKLATHANRQQLSRIKTVFEKKNQKSAANIQQLQKKLDSYQKRLRQIDIYAPNSTQRQPKDVLRGMSHGLKRTVISKPKEIAHMLKSRFGSADNIKEMGEDDKDEDKTHHGSATLPPNSGLHPTPTSGMPSSTFPPTSNNTAMGSSGGAGSSAGGKGGSDDGSQCSSSLLSENFPQAPPPNPAHPFSSPKTQNAIVCASENANLLDSVLQELSLRQDENTQIRDDIESMKQTVTQEVFLLRQSLTEEKYRVERLEEQINDLTELHQNEMENLKMGITDMEEKVQYQSEERIRDLHELVENCQTRISRMEHQQAQQQQQFLTLEGLENGNARALVVKLINILLTALQVVLLIVATVAGILTPLLQTRARVFTTATLVVLFVCLYMHTADVGHTWAVFLNKFNTSLKA